MDSHIGLLKGSVTVEEPSKNICSAQRVNRRHYNSLQKQAQSTVRYLKDGVSKNHDRGKILELFVRDL